MTLRSESLQTPEQAAATCEDNFSNPIHVESLVLDADEDVGQAITSITTQGVAYRIDTLGVPWTEGDGTEYYDAQITRGGTNPYEALVDYTGALCVVDNPYGGDRVYFSANPDPGYSMRVNDHDSDFTNNSGQLLVNIYRVDYEVGVWDEDWQGDTPYPQLIGSVAVNYQYCYGQCVQPSHQTTEFGIPGFKLFNSNITIPSIKISIPIPNVSGWIEHARCTIMQYFAWCPRHSNTIATLPDPFYEREPFSAMAAFIEGIRLARDEMQSKDWGQGRGGVEDPDEVNRRFNTDDIFPTLPDDSPYNGGQIQLTGGEDSYRLMCDHELEPVVGIQVSGPMCFILTLLDHIGVMAWLQLVVDFLSVLMMATGVKSALF